MKQVLYICCFVLYQVAYSQEVGTLHLLCCVVSGCLLSGGRYSTSVVLCCIRLLNLRKQVLYIYCFVFYQVANSHEIGTRHLLFCIVSGYLLSGRRYSTSVVLYCIRLLTLRKYVLYICCFVLYQVASKQEVCTVPLLFCIVSGCQQTGSRYCTSVVLYCIRLLTLRKQVLCLRCVALYQVVYSQEVGTLHLLCCIVSDC